MAAKAKESLLSEEELSLTSYYFKNGLRCVTPYHFEFKVKAKGRWIKRELIDVLVNEFSETREEILAKIDSHIILLNNKPTSESATIKEHDELTHTIHRHEPPVIGDIKIIYSSPTIIVIDKPCSIPVHPSGRYRFNSILYILAIEHGLNDLYLVHRLDRLTSGVLLLARNKEVASEYGNLIKDGKVQKHYLAKVVGKFPEGLVDCDKSITQVTPKLGYNEVSDDGKPSRTIFVSLSYNSTENTSVVYCYPVTGRTHQIRVHLYSLGHQIENDPLYKEKKAVKGQEATVEERTSPYFDVNCKDCLHPFVDPEESQLILYLHAYCYESDSKQFVTDIPAWSFVNKDDVPILLQNIENAKRIANEAVVVVT